MKSNLFASLLIFLAIRDVISNDVEVKVGDTINICCRLAFEKEDGLVIYADSTRLKMFIKDEVQELDFSQFNKKYPDYTVEKINSTLCLTKPGALLSDDSFKAVCKVIKSGMFKTLGSEEIVLRVYEELKFTETPPLTLNVSIGESKSVQCAATGSPDLQILWRNQNQGKIISGQSSATLEIVNITSDMNQIKYTCEASTSIPKTKPGSIISASMILDVYFKPEMNIEVSVVHTDLATGEIVKITVKGNPTPKLDCRLLDIKADRVVSVSNTSPYTYLWEMEIFNITEKHIGDYSCTASNVNGFVTKIVSLNLKPANLQITSKNETVYSDFYLFTWSVNSKAPITTIAITIGIIDTVNGSIEKLVKLAGNELKSFERESGNKENNWKRTFSYPLYNLTSNKSHKLTLRVCNKHDCVESVSSAYFTTQTFDVGVTVTYGGSQVPRGTNRYDPKNDPQSSNLSGQGNSSLQLLLSQVLVVVQSTIFCVCLMLHRIY